VRAVRGGGAEHFEDPVRTIFMFDLTDKIISASSANKSAMRGRFTPCTPRISLLEAMLVADDNFRMNLPDGFVRKNPGRSNQQPNKIQLLKERTRQRQLK
jgi:hypothetical protein